MELRILAIGKLKSPGLEALCEAWATRSRKSGLPIRLQVCRDAAQQWAQARNIGGPIVAVDERGEQIDSPTLAGWLSAFREAGTRAVSFVVGDAHGHAEADRAASSRVLALSRLTLPHRLAQVVLCEQLYRAGTILAGHPYHHD